MAVDRRRCRGDLRRHHREPADLFPLDVAVRYADDAWPDGRWHRPGRALVAGDAAGRREAAGSRVRLIRVRLKPDTTYMSSTIFTTHVGSLIRPPALLDFIRA